MQQRHPPQRKHTLPRHRDTAAHLPGSESQSASSDGKAGGMGPGAHCSGRVGCRGVYLAASCILNLGPHLTSDPVTHFWKSVPHVHLVTCEAGSVRAHHCGGPCNKERWETTLSLSKGQLNKLWNACTRGYYVAMRKERKRPHALISRTSGSVIHGISRCRTRE